ncbi:hypothetical protein LEP1GSC038_0152 [Leptospira weilii str. 2006001855]|uniref:Integrase core domain protein n=2 Tax=Leptospira weilii TaxID=28184 RepID=M6QTL2_9LEPT|nr:hypothetical protein LEP1GSC038_0152 [Leptospira weilii str. 2006001855]EMN92147.1 hypothetical protein LEP1GSC108_0315 [Leptospira weilii str. UI 13098]OMI18511.1 hypothetical protein BUQ74_04490 [Leptospira weilii serovar Heyan]QDK21918.1 transposase [Leptospira weilii]QDK25857.1 transposase [Leptospira weilii]
MQGILLWIQVLWTHKSLQLKFQIKVSAQNALNQAVFLYNNVRLHQNLGFLTPEFFHRAS